MICKKKSLHHIAKNQYDNNRDDILMFKNLYIFFTFSSLSFCEFKDWFNGKIHWISFLLRDYCVCVCKGNVVDWLLNIFHDTVYNIFHYQIFTMLTNINYMYQGYVTWKNIYFIKKSWISNNRKCHYNKLHSYTIFLTCLKKK